MEPLDTCWMLEELLWVLFCEFSEASLSKSDKERGEISPSSALSSL